MVRGEGVAAHDVEADELRPPLVALDAGLAGIAGGGDFGRVRFEILGADPGAAPDQRAFPDLGGGMRRTRGSRPDRVCIRVSKQTRWMRCRDSTHHARADETAGSTAGPDRHGRAVRMTSVQVAVTALASSQSQTAAGGQGGSSVRNRQMTPAALWCTWTNIRSRT